ncbi:glycosyltransferase family 9 protein [Nannocystis pusilla]|uniref:glycosyltransferase family 9 protein n=1 Tax=Nannocystis pusilla TaxID=889268 RepID=UPI003B7ED4C5
MLGPRALDLVGETDLPEFAALLAGARLVLTNNTAALHLADALAVPQLVTYAGTDRDSQWMPRTSPTACCAAPPPAPLLSLRLPDRPRVPGPGPRRGPRRRPLAPRRDRRAHLKPGPRAASARARDVRATQQPPRRRCARRDDEVADPARPADGRDHAGRRPGGPRRAGSPAVRSVHSSDA